MKAFRANGIDDNYPQGYGVRLDSGDLAYLSIEVRKILDENGFTKCKIFATNSLDEYLISDLERQGACIDCYGVGDAIATSKEAPCFGNVYKLVQLDGQAVMKMSEDRIKTINPGFQRSWRISNAEGTFKADLTCLRGDDSEKKLQNNEEITIFDEIDRFKFKTFLPGQYSAKELQVQMIENGKRCFEEQSLEEKRQYYKENLNRLSASEKRLINPHYFKVDISAELHKCKYDIIDRLVKEIEEFKD